MHAHWPISTMTLSFLRLHACGWMLTGCHVSDAWCIAGPKSCTLIGQCIADSGVESDLKSGAHWQHLLGPIHFLNFEFLSCILLSWTQPHYKTLVMDSKICCFLFVLKMVLTMNNFRFDGNNYLQIAGTAMGTRVAPTYANIFISDFESRHVYTYPEQPLLWARFIDDIFLIWEHGAEALDKFINHLNNVHQSIKFTSEISPTKANFLDTCVAISEDGKLTTDLYTKPTDSNNYLLYLAAHPTHCKRGIPFGQFLRLCSDDDLL